MEPQTRERRSYESLPQEDDVDCDVESMVKVKSSVKKKKSIVFVRLKICFLLWIPFFVLSIVIYLHEYIMLGYSMAMFKNQLTLHNGTWHMQEWDLQNIIDRNNYDHDFTTNKDTSTKLEFINDVSAYAPPPEEEQPLTVDSQEKLAPFLVDPYVSIPAIRWKNYCTFHPAPRFDKINVIDFIKQGSQFSKIMNPWHCVNEYPLEVWCFVTALHKYPDYQYDILLPEEYNNETWCAQMISILISKKRDNDLRDLPKHHLSLRRSWYEKFTVTSNFFTFDVNQKSILEYSYLQQAMMGNEPRRSISDGVHDAKEEYAVFMQRKGTRKMVDYQTYDFETIMKALEKKGGIPNIKIAYFEDLDLACQIELISQAKLFIGVHGAGLMNMLWLPKHAGVVEVLLRNHFGKDMDKQDKGPLLPYNKGDYFNLAKYLDLKYKFYDPAHISAASKNRPISMKQVYINSQEFADLVTKFWHSL